MRVHLALHGYPPLSNGGTQEYTAALARRLLDAGHAVTVLAYAPGDSAEVLVREETVAGQRVLWLTFDPHQSPNPVLDEYANARVARRLDRLWADERPDLVHATYLGLLSTAPVEAAHALGIPTVVTLTDMWAICPVGTLLRHDGNLCSGPDEIGHCVRCVTGMGPRGRPYAAAARAIPLPAWRAAAGLARRPGLARLPYMAWIGALAERPATIRRALGSASAVLSPGRFAVAVFERNGYPAGMVHALPHGIEAPEGLRCAARPADGEARPADGEALRLGYIGPLAWFKGAHLPLQAFRSLPAGPDVTLTYYGARPEATSESGYARGLLRAIEATPGAAHRGPFPHARVAEVLAETDVLIVPSLCYENTPLVIYEALASGTPVIATAEGGMRELIEDLGGGWLIPRGDVAALAALVARLRGDPAEVRRMAGTIRSVPSLADHVEALEAVYARAICPGGARA